MFYWTILAYELSYYGVSNLNNLYQDERNGLGGHYDDEKTQHEGSRLQCPGRRLVGGWRSISVRRLVIGRWSIGWWPIPVITFLEPVYCQAIVDAVSNHQFNWQLVEVFRNRRTAFRLLRFILDPVVLVTQHEPVRNIRSLSVWPINYKVYAGTNERSWKPC